MTAKRTTTNDSHLCLFSFSDGRQCRMLRHKDHSTLCIFHARAERQLIEADKLGREIAAPPSGEYLTAVDVNHVLGKLFAAFAQNRLPTPNPARLRSFLSVVTSCCSRPLLFIFLPFGWTSTFTFRLPTASLSFLLPIFVPPVSSVVRPPGHFVCPSLSGR